MNRVVVRSEMYIYTEYEFKNSNYTVEKKKRRGFVFSDFIRIFDSEIC